MLTAPIPSREAARLAALHRYRTLDTSPEPVFDELASLAAYVCRTPIAVISLVDSTRQWFKSVVGLPFTESPRSLAFCAYAILGTGLFIVEEAAADERFADHPWVVGLPSIRFYAGVPLITSDGHAIGTLAVMDMVPRMLTPEQRSGMQTLAAQVMAQFELREHRCRQSQDRLAVPEQCRDAKTALRESEERNALALRGMSDGVWDWNLLTGEASLSPRWKELPGLASDELPNREETFFDRLHPDDVSNVQGALRAHLERREPYDVELRLRWRDGAYRWFRSRGQALWDVHGRAYRMVGVLADITERKRSEDIISHGRELMRSFITHAPAPIAMLDRDLRYVAVSRRWLEDYRLGEQNLIGKHHYDVFPEIRTMEEWQAIHQRCLAGAVEKRESQRFVRADGSENWLRWEVRPWLDADGAIGGIIMLTEDITERKRSEAALRDSEERLRLAMDTAGMGAWDWAAESNAVTYSATLGPLFGLAPGARHATVEEFLSVIVPEDRERVSLAIGRCRDGGTPFCEEYRTRWPDGTVRWLSDRGQVYRNEQGQPVRMLGVVMDITERKGAEERLRRSEAYFRALIEQSADIVTVLGLDGIIRFESPSFERLLGYAQHELDGQSVLAYIHQDDVSGALDKFERIVREPGTLHSAEFHFRHKDGSWRNFEGVGRVVQDSQGQPCVIVNSRDITERTRVQEEQAKQERLITLMLNTGPGCIKRVAADGTLLHMNPAGLKLIEACREEEAVGRSVFDLVCPEHRDAFMRMHHDVIGGAARTLQFKVQGLQGTSRWLETHAVPFQNPVTGGTEHLAITYDISERKKAEDALRLSQERLHQALQASNTGLWDWNTATNAVSFSKEWKSQLGYGESELPDCFETWASRLHPDDQDRAIRYAQAYCENPVGVFRQDFRLRHKDGSYRWIDSQASFVTEEDGRKIRLLGSHTDITERKQTEEALSKSEERFNYAIEATNEGVWDWDITTGSVYFSPQWIRLLGYLPEEISPSTDFFFSILHPDDVARTKAVLQEHLDGHIPVKELELRLRQKSGEYRWYLDCGKVVARGQDGSSLRMVGTIADISMRKQAELERARALHSLQIIMETVPDVIFALDLEGRLSQWNPRMECVTGYGADELFLKPALEMVPLDEAARTSAAIKEAFDVGYAELEGHLLAKDGRAIPYHWTGAPFTDLQGRVIGITGVGRDITERRHAEALLRFSEERFRLVAEATNDILWDWDLVTQDHWWSPNAQDKFGYDPNAERSVAAWIGRLHPDDRDHVMAIVDDTLASEARTVTAEYRFRLADGSYGHFYDRGQIIRDSTGQAVRMVGAMIDVTFSKRAYASLETAYQRLQSMSRELHAVETNERRRLSRELHDEVGQLLTALKFDLEASRQALSDRAVAEVGCAYERTVRALETTDELFVRLRRVVRALRPSVLEELGLKDALEAMVSDIQSRSDLVCSVSVEGEAVEDPATPAIEAALYRMAQELVTNVVRHAQAMTLSIAVEIDAGQWMLTVQDDGIGFNPKAESISGMGIRGIRERAEILGGHMAVSSLPGAGTTITVWIPVRARAVSGDGGNGM